MCFNIACGMEEALYAKEDIECWKIIREDNTPVYIWTHQNDTPYIINKLAKKVPIIKEHNFIYRGYHSSKENYKNELIPYALESSDTILREDLRLARFIIPKGTRYYENKSEYVSETIKLID